MMKCELLVNEFFKLSIGHIALVGKLTPNLEKNITSTKADLYINGERIKTINLLGEDRFSGGDVKKRRGMRAVRTEDDIESELTNAREKEIKLIIYI